MNHENDESGDVEEWRRFDGDKEAVEVGDVNSDRSSTNFAPFLLLILFVSDSIFDLLLLRVVGSVG